MDEWVEEIAQPLPKFEFKMTEGNVIFIQTALGKYDKYEVIDGELVFQSKVE